MTQSNKYLTPHGWMPAWQLSDDEIKDAYYFSKFEEMLFGMMFDKLRVAELETEMAIRLSPENIVRFWK